MSIEKTFAETLKDENLQVISVDIAEVAIDSALEEGLFKEMPIISTFIGLYKTGVNIHDQLMIKKILTCIQPISSVDYETREKMIRKIDESNKYRISVSEKLLYLIDSCDDYEASERIGHLFRYMLKGNITYDEYLMTAPVLRNLSTPDFNDFIEEKKLFQYDEPRDLLHTGLYDFNNEPVSINLEKIDDTDDSEDDLEAHADGGVYTSLTRKGEIILEIFAPNYKEQVKEFKSTKIVQS